MFITRAHLNPRRTGARKLLTNPRAMHGLINNSFPDQPPTPPGEAPPRALWRVDTDDPYHPVLFAVSPTPPDFTQLIEDAGWPAATTPQWHTKLYTPLLDRLETGQRYAFRLTASPTYRLASPARNVRGKRLPHTTVADQITWLTKKAIQHGFNIPPTRYPADIGPDGNPPLQLHLRDRGTNRFTKPDPTTDKRNQVSLTTATYEGILHVTDPSALRQTLTTGIGQGRAYGCGLLTLARPNESKEKAKA